MSEHSPTPWKLTPNTLGNIEDANGRAIMQAQQTKPIRKSEDHAERLANAEITVRAVNLHDDLLAALKHLSSCPAMIDSPDGKESMSVGQFVNEFIAKAENRATIQSAGGGK